MTTMELNGAVPGARRANAVTGVKVWKLDDGAARAAAEAEGVDAGSLSTEQVSVALDAAYRAAGVELAQCENCEGVSPASMSVCPHCGMDSEVDAAGESPPVGAESTPAPAPPPIEDLQGKPPAEATPSAKEAKEAKERLRRDAREAKKVSPAPKAPTPSTALATTAPSAPAKVDDSTPSSELLTEHTLDEAISRVRKFSSDSSSSLWLMGAELRRIKDQKLYLLRPGADKKTPKYKTWEAFATSELQITPGYATNLIDAASTHSREQIEAVGRSRFLLLWKFPEEERKKIEQQVFEGKVRTPELKKRLREVNKKLKAEGAKTTRRDGVEIAHSGGRKPEKMTIAMIEGKHQLKFFKGPIGADFDPKRAPRAKSLGDHPVAVWTLENGVVVEIEVAKTDKGLIAKVVGKRAE